MNSTEQQEQSRLSPVEESRSTVGVARSSGSLTPQERPDLFSDGPWPVLNRQQRTIFEGRESPARRELDDVDSERRSVGPSAVEWYEAQVQRHGCLKRLLGISWKRGFSIGLLYGLAALCIPRDSSLISLASDNETTPTACRCWLPPFCEPHVPPSLASCRWDDKERVYIMDAAQCGISAGVVANSGFWFALLLVVAIAVGVSGTGTSSFLVALILLTVLLFMLVLGTSCFHGHRKKRSSHEAVLHEDVPRHIPCLLQLEIAQRNARVMDLLVRSETHAQNSGRLITNDGALADATEHARAERALSREVAALSVKQRVPAYYQQQRTEKHSVAAADGVSPSSALAPDAVALAVVSVSVPCDDDDECFFGDDGETQSEGAAKSAL